MNYQSLLCFLLSSESTDLSVQKKRKKDFQDGCNGGLLRLLIGTILTFFDVQVTPKLPTQVQVNWHSGSGEEVKNRFLRWPPWWPSWISDGNNFNFFLSTSHLSQLAFQFRRNFQDGRRGVRFGFSIETILAIFLSSCHPDASYQVSSPFGSGEEVKYRFSRPWISDQKDFSYFDLQVTPMIPTKFQVSWSFGSEGVQNRFSRWRPSLISDRNDLNFFDLQVPTMLTTTAGFKFRSRSEK